MKNEVTLTVQTVREFIREHDLGKDYEMNVVKTMHNLAKYGELPYAHCVDLINNEHIVNSTLLDICIDPEKYPNSCDMMEEYRRQVDFIHKSYCVCNMSTYLLYDRVKNMVYQIIKYKYVHNDTPTAESVGYQYLMVVHDKMQFN